MASVALSSRTQEGRIASLAPSEREEEVDLTPPANAENTSGPRVIFSFSYGFLSSLWARFARLLKRNREVGAGPAEPVTTQNTKRPTIRFVSIPDFLETFLARFVSIWTKSFFLGLLGTQFVSLCYTGVNVMTYELALRRWNLSMTQTLFWRV